MHVSRRKKCVLCAQVARCQMKRNKLKSPTCAYLQFLDNFVAKNIKLYGNLDNAVAAGITALLQCTLI